MDKALLDLERWLDRKKLIDYEVTINGTDPYVGDSDIFDINIERDEIEARFILDETGVDET